MKIFHYYPSVKKRRGIRLAIWAGAIVAICVRCYEVPWRNFAAAISRRATINGYIGQCLKYQSGPGVVYSEAAVARQPPFMPGGNPFFWPGTPQLAAPIPPCTQGLYATLYSRVWPSVKYQGSIVLAMHGQRLSNGSVDLIVLWFHQSLSAPRFEADEVRPGGYFSDPTVFSLFCTVAHHDPPTREDAAFDKLAVGIWTGSAVINAGTSAADLSRLRFAASVDGVPVVCDARVKDGSSLGVQHVLELDPHGP